MAGDLAQQQLPGSGSSSSSIKEMQLRKSTYDDDFYFSLIRTERLAIEPFTVELMEVFAEQQQKLKELQQRQQESNDDSNANNNNDLAMDAAGIIKHYRNLAAKVAQCDELTEGFPFPTHLSDMQGRLERTRRSRGSVVDWQGKLIILEEPVDDHHLITRGDDNHQESVVVARKAVKRVVIGTGGFRFPPDADGTVEIGYALNEKYRGKGYATEASKAMIEWAAGTGQVKRVIGKVLPSNHASKKVLQRIGLSMRGMSHYDDGATECELWELILKNDKEGQ